MENEIGKTRKQDFFGKVGFFKVCFKSVKQAGELNKQHLKMNETHTQDKVVSTVSTTSAVIVRDAEICYTKGHPVLSGFNMNVPCGSIYGLLGSSGCGKTTILSCLLGQQKLDSGEIRVYNHKPGTKSSGVPGRNVGYMPQDISLYMEFSIKETLHYFGQLAGMDHESIRKEYKYLVKLMDLPKCNRKVSTLSGGEKRRLSLATALIHGPKLLILDEPTVGVDPVLRQRIWHHMRSLVVSNQTTVIITSHYIEECRQADVIGFIRDGRLLTEKSPVELFQQYDSNNLETIILNLARGKPVVSSAADQPAIMVIGNNDSEERSIQNDSTDVIGSGPIAAESRQRLRALFRKNYVLLTRNPWLLAFTTFVQPVIIIVILLALGKTPLDMGLGIVNNEMSNAAICQNITHVSDGCDGELLSCHFVEYISPENFNLKWFKSEQDAIRETESGNIWGYLSFPPDYSERLIQRMMGGGDVDELTFNHSQITIRLDETNAQTTMAIKLLLHQAYLNFLTSLMTICGYDSRQVELPIKYRASIFGSNDTEFREYLIGGISVGMMFQFATFTMCIRVIGEKKSGILTRSMVTGVKTWEILVSYLVTEFPVLLIQSVLSYLVVSVVFGIHIMGSHVLIIVIYLLSAFNGTVAGYLLGMFLDEELTAAVISVAINFPIYFISGFWWPVEGMTAWFRYISPFTPFTLAGESIRSLISRGWGFTHPNVWPGVAVPAAYASVFLIAICCVNRLRQY